jgi:hypothetical protein
MAGVIAAGAARHGTETSECESPRRRLLLALGVVFVLAAIAVAAYLASAH